MSKLLQQKFAPAEAGGSSCGEPERRGREEAEGRPLEPQRDITAAASPTRAALNWFYWCLESRKHLLKRCSLFPLVPFHGPHSNMETELFMECEEEELEPWQQVDDSVEEEDVDFVDSCDPGEQLPPPVCWSWSSFSPAGCCSGCSRTLNRDPCPTPDPHPEQGGFKIKARVEANSSSCG